MGSTGEAQALNDSYSPSRSGKPGETDRQRKQGASASTSADAPDRGGSKGKQNMEVERTRRIFRPVGDQVVIAACFQHKPVFLFHGSWLFPHFFPQFNIRPWQLPTKASTHSSYWAVAERHLFFLLLFPFLFCTEGTCKKPTPLFAHRSACLTYASRSCPARCGGRHVLYVCLSVCVR